MSKNSKKTKNMEKNQNQSNSVKSLGIVKAVMAFFNLGEEGKLASFFGKLIRQYEKAIQALKHNLSTVNFNHERNLENLNEQLQDANDNLEDAYRNVDIERIKTNADQDSFMKIYENSLDEAETRISRIESSIEAAKEAHEAQVIEINDQIAEYQRRIDNLTKDRS